MSGRSRALLWVAAGLVCAGGVIAAFVMRGRADRAPEGAKSTTANGGAAVDPRDLGTSAGKPIAGAEAKVGPVSRKWTLLGRTVRQLGSNPEGGSPAVGVRVRIAIAPPWPV
ncbi:MAG TPA: hypothetical protein VFD71_18695, partial [Planctomycetota bacterium]|nr:hypothetical protein [Planctomycetota bacterium]